MRVAFCGSCGAPIDAPWDDLAVVCGSCGSQNLPDGTLVAPRVPIDGRPRINLGGRTYVLEGRLGDGDSTVVYRGRWVVRLGERVVIKVQASDADTALLRREWQTLGALHAADAPGAQHFRTRLPSPVAHGLIDTDRPRVASAFGWKSGFVHTLSEVGELHQRGVPGPVTVWLLKRLLELLGFVHRAGYVHGAVVPDHVLVHPRDHGAVLVGWTAARPLGTPLDAIPSRWTALYPRDRTATPALDIAMATKVVHGAGGYHLPGVRPHRALARVFDEGMSGRATDAWKLSEQLVQASNEAYGPPAYNPLMKPGWR